MRIVRKAIWTTVMGALGVGLVGAFTGDSPAVPEPCPRDSAAPNKYVGVAKCKICHKAEKKGNQFGVWEKMKHAKAYEALASDEAKKIAAERGIADPQKSDECLRCHVTGHGEPADLFDKKFNFEDGVQCESCHGPGSGYLKKETMESREASVAGGLAIPTKETCEKCHNTDSPNYKPFCFAHFLAKIYHPNPEIKKEARTIECTCEEKADLKIDENGKTSFVGKCNKDP